MTRDRLKVPSLPAVRAGSSGGGIPDERSPHLRTQEGPGVHQSLSTHKRVSSLGLWARLILTFSLPIHLLAASPDPQAQPQPGLLPFEPELGAYATQESVDPVGRLARRLERGEVRLQREEPYGYLLPLLRELHIPVESQLLVYSKTSLQRPHISSSTPRAIYHHQQTYVAWIPTAPLIELLGFDPKLGTVLYTLSQTNSGAPKLVRENRCLECHVSPKTLEIPGALVRSFHTTPTGDIDLLTGSVIVNHATPYEERWGGWYVTGLSKASIRSSSFAGASEGLTSLAPPEGLFQQHPYPCKTSDVISMLIFEHEAHMQNLLTRLAYESSAQARTGGDGKSIHALGERVLEYLLFTQEAPLPPMDKAEGEFAHWFQKQGVKDKKGRSLWDLDLQTRLFKNPCSFLIYSDSFRQLPRETKSHLYHRLWNILSGDDASENYRQLTPQVRTQIREILTETLPDLPAYWTL